MENALSFLLAVAIDTAIDIICCLLFFKSVLQCPHKVLVEKLKENQECFKSWAD